MSKFHCSVSNIFSKTSIWIKTSLSSIYPFFYQNYFPSFLSVWAANAKKSPNLKMFFWNLLKYLQPRQVWHLLLNPMKNKSKSKKNSFGKLRLIWAISEKACFSSNWCCGQSIKLRPIKFLYKKRQTYYYKRKQFSNQWEEAAESKSLTLFPSWDWWLGIMDHPNQQSSSISLSTLKSKAFYKRIMLKLIYLHK